jgi:hypothetical protein
MKLWNKFSKGLVVSLLALSIAEPSFAAENTKIKTNDSKEKVVKVIYQKKEEKDLTKLFEKAKNHLSDVDLKSLPIEANNPGEVKTAQLLDVSTMGDQTVKDFAVTTFVIDEDAVSVNGEITPFATGTRSDSAYDNTISYKSYSTIYYTESVVSGNTYIKLTRATGGWTQNDSSVTIAKKLVRLGCSSLTKTQVQEYTSFSGNTFDITAPSSWVQIEETAYSIVGATMETTYNRHGSTWTHVFSNNMSW